jgi:hypothetical protein
MDAFENLFARKLRDKLIKEISERDRQIADGKAVDYADYKAKVAFAAGMRHALDFMEIVHTELMRPEEHIPRRRGVA